MSKVLFNDTDATAVRKLLDSLMIIRANCIQDRKPVNSAIRAYCKAACGGTTYPETVKSVARQIGGKMLCEPELLKAVEIYNQLLSGELEVVIDGQVVNHDGELTNPIG